MPHYDYRCEDCGHLFEVFQSISAEPLRDCPSCGRPRLSRLIGGGGGLLFRGTGFYATDYRSAAPPPTPGESCTPTGCSKPGCPNS